ncbi:hypothetical protein HNW13_000155 [Shewanella sp. BF02_Schw]|uniref:hypothetical protein n=1 Tax=Shewanella sp. BF02_Schw TaxID=394908 RepID=UPI00178363C8|nr:hypothetical protein [Shewanella sp. BF02_Schw]MBO1894217.1 hypothetical protein [Shewanella sp. BF02_Schw]
MQKLISQSRVVAIMAAMITLVFMPFAALAVSPELTDQISLPLDALPGWVGIVVAVLYGVAHAVALLPAPVTDRLPRWVKWLLKYVAANYGKAKNRDL